MPRQKPPPSNERVVLANGRVFLYKGDKMVFEIPKGKKFAGAIVHKSGRWSTCPKCNKRIAIGARCTCGKKIRDHQDQNKPDNIKGE